MRVCGQCAWYEYEKEEPDYGDCMAPLPMTLDSENTEPYNIDYHSDATACVCFKARVSDCQHCDGEGFIYPLVNGKVGERTPCPACHGKEGKE